MRLAMDYRPLGVLGIEISYPAGNPDICSSGTLRYCVAVARFFIPSARIFSMECTSCFEVGRSLSSRDQQEIHNARNSGTILTLSGILGISILTQTVIRMALSFVIS